VALLECNPWDALPPVESELSDIETTSHLAFLDDEIVRVKARAEQLEEERLVI